VPKSFLVFQKLVKGIVPSSAEQREADQWTGVQCPLALQTDEAHDCNC